MSVTLAGSAFTDGQPIPEKYTQDGANQSPSLHWNAARRKPTSGP